MENTENKAEQEISLEESRRIHRACGRKLIQEYSDANGEINWKKLREDVEKGALKPWKGILKPWKPGA